MRGILLAGCLAAGAAAAVAATTPKLARLNAAEIALSGDQARNERQLARLLSVLVQLKRDPPPALLVAPEDARDAVRAAILVKAMTPELQARAQVYAAGASEVLRQRRLAAVQSEALFERESLAADRLPEPEPQALPRARYDDILTPPSRLVYPTAGRLTRGFDQPLAGGGRASGLTFTAAKGARAVSPGDGLVQYVGPVKGWGVIVILRLAGGYHLVLAGLERTSVSVGQSVAAGQPVGWASDGRQSAPELYLEVRAQGSPVDPAPWLVRQPG